VSGVDAEVKPAATSTSAGGSAAAAISAAAATSASAATLASAAGPAAATTSRPAATSRRAGTRQSAAEPAEGARRDADCFDIEIDLLLEGVYRHYQHDFRHYARVSLRRRIRAAMDRFGCGTVSQLQDRILHEPEVFSGMLQYFTVQVSEMFRDPSYFRSLRERVVPELRTYPSVKVWVAGCSTGEELWSLAILFHEESLLARTIFYATDINPGSLRAAARGVYPLERMASFSRNYLAAGGKGSLSDYYTAAYDGAILGSAFKSQVVFADHSLATDSVFSEVHLVSCRNVLIYFDATLRDRAVGLFRDALVHRGFLGIGMKESLGSSAHASAFAEHVPADRIYLKVAP
jgi:chemotaxis protein methyltransferase CheR